MYVARRRKGQVGPGAAPILLKQACVQGATHSVYSILRLYFAPLQSEWMISLCRAFILLASSLFPYVIYQHTVKRAYIAYRSDLDRTIDQALRKLDQANKALQSFAVDALQIIAVGGVAALFPTLRDAVVTEAQQQLQQDEQQQFHHQQQKPVAHASRGLGGGGEGGSSLRLASVVDGNDNSCSDVTLRPQTHFQQPDERVDAIATALAGQHLNGAIQRSVVQPPKPRYEDAYQMRLQFRRRASMRANKKKSEQ